MRTLYAISTICYLEKEKKVLFLKFDKKWGQVYCPPGGKINAGESPIECIIREFRVETGLELQSPKFKGYSHWNYCDKEYGIIFIYTAKDFDGSLIDKCTDGDLSWISKEDIANLQQFEMNSKFTNFVFEDGLFEGHFNLDENDKIQSYKINKM